MYQQTKTINMKALITFQTIKDFLGSHTATYVDLDINNRTVLFTTFTDVGIALEVHYDFSGDITELYPQTYENEAEYNDTTKIEITQILLTDNDDGYVTLEFDEEESKLSFSDEVNEWITELN